MRRKRWRLPMMVAGLVVLILAVWGGLVRIGWAWPMPGVGSVAFHGPLMVGGFLGTLLSLERAVALGRRWPYAAPFAAAVSGLALLLGLPVLAGQFLQAAAGVILIAVFVNIIRRQPTMFTTAMGLGALAWTVGSLLWMAGRPIPSAVPWWIAFLVLTIVGERLELSRFLSRTLGKEITFLSAVGIYFLGVVLGIAWPGLGWAIAGFGMLAMAAWLVVYDLAMRTVRAQGLTRYVAACLLSGYFWLAAGGVIILSQLFLGLHSYGESWLMAAPTAGLMYDAILHAVLIGFVFTMIFGHAPIIFPSVLAVRMEYRPRFYAHLVLLELSVVLRVVGDAAGWDRVRQWAGLLNAAAILLFLGQTISTLRRRRTGPQGGPRSDERGRIGLTINLDPPRPE